MSDLPPDVQEGFRVYLGLGPDKDGPVLVHSSDTTVPGTVEGKISDINPPPPGDDPAGIGRLVILPAGSLTTQEILLSQAQSLRAVKGSAILKLEHGSPLTERHDGIAAYVTIDEPFYTKDGIAGQGVIQDLDIDASYGDDDPPEGITAVHGLYAPPRGDDPSYVHTMRNVAVYNARNNGIHLDVGNDRLVADRLRSELANGIGIYMAGSDVKLRAVGSVAFGSALKVSGSAIEMDQFDLWRPDHDFTSDPTLEINGGANGCVIKSGTVSGKTLFIGNNNSEDTSYHYINTKAQFAFVHFKHDENQSDLDCYFEAKSADLVELISCKFGASGTGTIEHKYPYLIKISAADDIGMGLLKITGGTGLVRFLGRQGTGNNRMVIDANKHICNEPKLLLFDWGRLGTIEMVPLCAVDSTNPLCTHLRCDGTQYNSRDQPFAYLNVDAYLDHWTAELHDNVNFNVPDLPALSHNCVPAIRAIP